MSRKRAAVIIAAALACVLGGEARSDAQGKSRGARGPTTAEFATLKQRVDEQHDLLMKLTQLEGQHYEFLLKLLQTNTRPGTAPIALPQPSPSSSSPSPAPSPSPESDASPTPAAHPKLATITGHVDVKGKPWGPIYVYVENIKEPAVDRSVEILQKDRAFVPNVLLVQRGTRVTFPNADPFLHNVFSPSPVQPFDLGSYRQGDKPGTVKLFTAGIVEVLCNMHAKMRANVLVVPNRHHVKASGDGSFRLENVPVGPRQIVAWTPDARPVTESVVLTPAGATVRFALQVEPVPPPIDKMGRPRPAYRQEE